MRTSLVLSFNVILTFFQLTIVLMFGYGKMGVVVKLLTSDLDDEDVISNIFQSTVVSILAWGIEIWVSLKRCCLRNVESDRATFQLTVDFMKGNDNTEC